MLIFQKGIKCESKERTCYYVQGKADGLQGTTPEDNALHLLAGARRARAVSAQVKKKRPGNSGSELEQSLQDFSE